MTDSSPVHHRSARKFDAELASRGLPGRVVQLPDSTRTAVEAATAVGCELRQIVKSLVFQTTSSGRPVLVLASGSNRVDEEWMARYAGEKLVRADPEFVRSVSGYAIGGVPPTGHSSHIPTYVDYDLLELSEVWAAAGHPHAVCRLSSRELMELTQGQPVPVTPLTPRPRDSASWVTFDCYGTLVDWRAGLLQQFHELAGASSRNDGEPLFQAYLREEQALERGPYRPYREVMAEAVLRAARSLGFELSAERAARVPESIPDWPAFPDTRRGLQDLHDRDFRIGILSNIDADLMERTLANLGTRADCIVTAQDVRSYKPAFAHWIQFLKRTGASPDKVWHGSASYEYDIDPARVLGFRTIYVARYGGPPVGKDVGLSVPGLTGLSDQLRSQPISPASR
jgi:2-haloalkanoic acid dehalogenase type II